jgi:hypothetical protein
MTRRAAAAGVVALVLSSCATASPSMSRLHSEATRVCDRARALGARIRAPAIPAQTTAFLRRGVAVLRPELAELRRLQAPSTEAGAYAVALGAMAQELSLLSATVEGLDRGADPLTAIKTLQRRLTPVEANNDAAWQTLGVPACVTS